MNITLMRLVVTSIFLIHLITANYHKKTTIAHGFYKTIANKRTSIVEGHLSKSIQVQITQDDINYSNKEVKIDEKNSHASISLETAKLRNIYNTTSNRSKRNASVPPDAISILTLSPWENWSLCNVSDCGVAGTQRRVRTCHVFGREATNQQICGEAITQLQNCEISCTGSEENESRMEIRPSWTVWATWGRCDRMCGLGTRTRRRQCTSSRTNVCLGPEIEQESCEILSICLTWLSWGHWSACSLTCGSGGIRFRERDCTVVSQEDYFELIAVDDEELREQILQNLTTPTVINPSHCPGGQMKAKDFLPCLKKAVCRSSWSTWSSWTTCSVTCGIGFISARRTCTGGDSDGVCIGSSTRLGLCFRPSCWSPWSKFTQCSKSCGSVVGYKIRTRECVKSKFISFHSKRCKGNDIQRVPCNTEPCPVWGPWTRFTRCSFSCNGGRATRTRQCLQGLCKGRSMQTTVCNYQPCPYWSSWTSFSCCSVSCGENNVKERYRTCRHWNARRRSPGCRGPKRETQPCQIHPCNATIPSLFSSFECGIRNLQITTGASTLILKILGGQISTKQRWPWQASWQHRACTTCNWIHYCGATLIAPQWVVTSSHCTEESRYRVNHENPGDRWSIVLGMHRLYEDGERFFIQRVFVHPQYEYNDVTIADVALLKLLRPVAIKNHVRPVCLPQLSRPQPGERCFITGWGYTDMPSAIDASLSEVLLEAEIPIVSFEKCQKLGLNYRTYLDPINHMCAGFSATAARDSCTGDSGGPLLCRRTGNQWYLAGVTSFGFEQCGTKGEVGIYTPMDKFQAWVRNTVEAFADDSC